MTPTRKLRCAGGKQVKKMTVENILLGAPKFLNLGASTVRRYRTAT